MITSLDTERDALERDRMLIVAAPWSGDRLVAEIRARYPEWDVAVGDDYLSSIADAARRPPRAVLACVDPALTQLNEAVAGLREAVGRNTRLILCCPSECEPIARRALESGADDYILYPLDGEELDAAIGHARWIRSAHPRLTEAPAASMDELVRLGAILARLGDRPLAVIERVASLIRVALHARAAMVVVEGATATSGETFTQPVLTAPLRGEDGVIGHLGLDERLEGAYTPGDVEKLTHYAAVVGHILKAASRQRHWRKLAATDYCSGLPNRRYFDEKLDEILVRASHEHFHVALLLFDVDDFKVYNDTAGHDAGDEIIRLTGQLFQQHCRDQDIVARYGGDEFAVVFWDPDGPRVAGSKHLEGALKVAERFNEALRTHPLPVSCGIAQLTISGGLATYPWDASTRQELFKRADEALLAAKRAGKNRIFLIGDAESHSS